MLSVLAKHLALDFIARSFASTLRMTVRDHHDVPGEMGTPNPDWLPERRSVAQRHLWHDAVMADDDPTTADGSKKPQILSYLNPRTLQQANRKTGQWITWFVRFCIYILMPVMLISILMPTFSHNRAREDRVKCASNLRQIGQALTLCYNDNKCWPRTRYDPTMALGNGFTGGGTADSFAVNGPSANDPTAAMFLLVKTTDLNQEVFICPYTNDVKDTFTVGGVAYKAGERSNFTGPNNLSYSFANMYPDTAAVERGYIWDPKVPPGFVVAADRNDGDTANTLELTSNAWTSTSRKMNSLNHNQAGQNVLYADGHVDWCETPWVGVQKDNIYTSAKVDTTGNQLNPAASAPLWPAPQGALDSVLVPRKGNGF
ncbi:MAG: hypothetical protein ABSH20_09465 [Tepidisphaeraceae bacterium]